MYGILRGNIFRRIQTDETLVNHSRSSPLWNRPFPHHSPAYRCPPFLGSFRGGRSPRIEAPLSFPLAAEFGRSLPHRAGSHGLWGGCGFRDGHSASRWTAVASRSFTDRRRTAGRKREHAGAETPLSNLLTSELDRSLPPRLGSRPTRGGS